MPERETTLTAGTGAGLTAGYLLGGLALGLALALPVSAIPTPGHPHLARNVASGLVLFTVVLLAARGWGRALAGRAGHPDPARAGRVAAATFAPALIVVGTVLGLLEPVFVRAGAERGWPVHVVYGMLFVPATGLVAGLTAFGLQRAMGGRRALAPALVAGTAAALAFLTVDVTMDALGWRVGAPRAAERATMLVVTLLGCLAAALAGGAVLGAQLRVRPSPAPTVPSS